MEGRGWKRVKKGRIPRKRKEKMMGWRVGDGEKEGDGWEIEDCSSQL